MAEETKKIEVAEVSSEPAPPATPPTAESTSEPAPPATLPAAVETPKDVAEEKEVNPTPPAPAEEKVDDSKTLAVVESKNAISFLKFSYYRVFLFIYLLLGIVWVAEDLRIFFFLISSLQK